MAVIELIVNPWLEETVNITLVDDSLCSSIKVHWITLDAIPAQ